MTYELIVFLVEDFLCPRSPVPRGCRVVVEAELVIQGLVQLLRLGVLMDALVVCRSVSTIAWFVFRRVHDVRRRFMRFTQSPMPAVGLYYQVPSMHH